jgi:hypothetical protein
MQSPEFKLQHWKKKKKKGFLVYRGDRAVITLCGFYSCPCFPDTPTRSGHSPWSPDSSLVLRSWEGQSSKGDSLTRPWVPLQCPEADQGSPRWVLSSCCHLCWPLQSGLYLPSSKGKDINPSPAHSPSYPTCLAHILACSKCLVNMLWQRHNGYLVN